MHSRLYIGLCCVIRHQRRQKDGRKRNIALPSSCPLFRLPLLSQRSLSTGPVLDTRDPEGAKSLPIKLEKATCSHGGDFFLGTWLSPNLKLCPPQAEFVLGKHSALSSKFSFLPLSPSYPFQKQSDLYTVRSSPESTRNHIQRVRLDVCASRGGGTEFSGSLQCARVG